MGCAQSVHKVITTRTRIQMASQRNKRTDAELKAASEAVDYETTMLWATLEILLSSNTNILSRAAAQAQSNMALHSFLLATRNLCGFLYSRSPYPNHFVHKVCTK